MRLTMRHTHPIRRHLAGRPVGRGVALAAGLMISSIALTLLLVGASRAEAALTSIKGSTLPASKYSQSQVEYTDLGSQIKIVHRYFRGGRGCVGGTCGADRWRMLQIRDEVSGVTQATFGPSAWGTAPNASTNNWVYFTGESQPTYGSGLTVKVHFLWEFDEDGDLWYTPEPGWSWYHSISP